ncbi:RYamide receptor-like [Dendronephthya gigantea]|uniref:RYamide receptor-like n=1 Tax=Dendronephthya gigantea TaxID=151771 RepID=UPI001069923B|nr:RYamide receptor-like [Dendronephthya gigantea]XP_028397599.1 RYamide receptor-like [Dendronephthya gigantea]
MNLTGNDTFPKSTHRNADIPLQDQVWFSVIGYILFGAAFIISICGNSLCAYIISTRFRMKSVTNLFILNLAIGDLIYTFSIPFDLAITENNQKWIFHRYFCHILSPVQTISMFSSLLTLTILSLTRYRAIIHPLKRQIEANTAKFCIVLIWVVSALTALPQVYYQRVNDDGKCEEEWESHQSAKKVYTAVLFGVQYVIPLTIMLIAYGRIGVELSKPSPGENTLIQEERGKEAKKVVSMLITVTATFAICTLPTSIMWLWLDFGNADDTFADFWNVLQILYFFDFVNLAAHPIIYVYFSKNFRSEMKATFQRKKHQAEHVGTIGHLTKHSLMSTNV